MASIDLKKKYKESYSARVGKPSVVEMTPRPFLMVDGAGDPNTAPEYASAVAALYPIAYAIRASIKTATGEAYSVLPLEGTSCAAAITRSTWVTHVSPTPQR